MTGVIDMSFINRCKKLFGLGAVAVASSIAAPAAMAQGTYDTLTAAVDWSDVGAALLTVFVAIIGVVVIFKGAKMVVKAVRGA